MGGLNMKEISVAVFGDLTAYIPDTEEVLGGRVSVAMPETLSPGEWGVYDAVLIFSGNSSGEVDPILASSLVGHPHLRVIAGIGDGARDAYRAELRALLSETECERKFLVSYPDTEALRTYPLASRAHLVQTYLRSEEGTTERVRMRETDGHTVYTHTVKRRIDNATAEEYEREIDGGEYLRLLGARDPDRRPVDKERWCVLYRGRYFELDVYPFWSDRAIVELEYAEATSEMPDFPPFFRLIREVTDDVRYKNVRLAASVPYDEI